MPAPYARRDAIQNLARAVNRTGLGQAQGRFRGLSPTSSGVGQQTRTDPSIQSYAELHHVQDWDVTDDATDTFPLDFEPSLESWNLMLNGLRVHRTEFEIDVKTLTILDPTDLFLGADTQGTPWELEIQYDYIVGAPNDLALRNVSTAEGSASTLNIAAPTNLAVGDLMVLANTCGWDITGVSGSWTVVEAVNQVGGGPPAQFTSVHKRTATIGDIGATYTLTYSAAAENQAAIVAYAGAAAVTAHSEVEGTTPQTETGISTSVAGSIVMHIVTARAATGTVTPLSFDRGSVVVDGETFGGNHALHITDEVQSAAGAIVAATASSAGSNPGQLGVIVLAISPT